jgi:uncharacterized protein YjiS (DUF1127 family)
MMTVTTPSTFFESAFETLAQRVRGAHSRRTQQLALASLLDMDAHQLDDLGLSVGDVLDALNSPPPVAPMLNARRSRRASTWTQDGAAAQ